MRSNSFYMVWLMIGLSCICGMCSKSDQIANNNSNTDSSDAGKIAGQFSGTGKRMPNGIFLGNFTGCVTPPNWTSNFETGSSTVTVSKVTDHSVNISISGGPFSLTTYSNITLTASGGTLNFSLGTYDVNSKSLALSINTGLYITTNACLQGLPYYSGYSALGNNTYGYQTIGHIDFTGTKQ